MPYHPHKLQNRKVPSLAAESARLEAIAAHVIESMLPGWLYVLGPGTTIRAITDRLGFPKTLVGVDVYTWGGVVALDVGESRLLELLGDHPTRIIVTPIGGQGFIFGRGNQPISQKVIHKVGRENIQVVSLSEKVNALGGEPLLVDTGDLLDGVKRFDIAVRLEDATRASVEALRRIPLRTAAGAVLPLSEVAEVSIAEGYSFVRREQLQRYAVIQMDVRGRDVDGFVKDAGAAIDAAVTLPPGYWIEWGGAFENQQRALTKLAVIVPVTIFFIFLLLYTAFNSVKYAALILANVPFATLGGIVALFITGQYLSVPSAIGFIAVFGVAMLNGIVLVSFLSELRDKGLSVRDAVTEGTALRLRPVLMTASVAILRAGLAYTISWFLSATQIPSRIASRMTSGLFRSPCCMRAASASSGVLSRTHGSSAWSGRRGAGSTRLRFKPAVGLAGQLHLIR